MSPLHFIPGNQNKYYQPGGRSAPNHGTLCALEISRASKEAKEAKGWKRVEIILPAFSLLSFLLRDIFWVSTMSTWENTIHVRQCWDPTYSHLSPGHQVVWGIVEGH